MKYLSMFSGIGGFELGIKRATDDSWECVGFSEIDESAIQTYKKHFPEHRNYGDANKINPKELPEFDLIIGGFPCQAFSGAGYRKGFNDTRGTLFFEIARIVKEKRPKYILLENVKGLLSHDKGRTFKIILSTLEELDYNTESLVFDSYYYDAAPRKRIYCFAYDRKQPTDDLQGTYKTIQAHLNFCERVANQDTTTRDEELGRVSSRIIRTFKQLPDWLDGWSTFYPSEETNRKCSNSQCN